MYLYVILHVSTINSRLEYKVRSKKDEVIENECNISYFNVSQQKQIEMILMLHNSLGTINKSIVIN